MNLKTTFDAVQQASRKLNLVCEEKINTILLALADETESQIVDLLKANQLDLDRMDPKDPKYDRLRLTETAIKSIANDIRNVASRPFPIGQILNKTERPNGMVITKVTVPIGVVGMIYEARPNVSFDVFSLCFKSGNAAILKGGSDAENSNRAIVKLIHYILQRYDIDKHIVELLPSDREATTQLLNAVGYVDLIIPRGSQGLINYVRDNSRVPIIETGAGICHTYFDESGDAEKGANIINNSKTRRVSVCNALDCLIINRSRLDALPHLCNLLSDSKVIIYADKDSYNALTGYYPPELLEHATPESFGIEFLSYKMSIKTVDNIEEAIEHITTYSSKHSEAIISENENSIALFENLVDAACVYANVSTSFTDGAQFGLGAEIGISTQKLHPRGPMGLEELTSYKYLIKGNGQIRNE